MSDEQTATRWAVYEPVGVWSPRINPELVVELESFHDAIIFTQMAFLIRISTNAFEGRYWVYKTAEQLRKEAFPFLSRVIITKSLQRICEQRHLLDRRNDFNKRRNDQTYWYAINPEYASRLTSVVVLPMDRNAVIVPTEQSIVPTEHTLPEIPHINTKDSPPAGETSRNDWYDAICDIWKYTGKMNGAMQKMLQGTATAKGWKEYNLEQPLASSAELRAWAAWYRATQLNGNTRLNMLERRDSIQSSIGYWQSTNRPDAPMTASDDDLPINNFDKMLEHLGL